MENIEQEYCLNVTNIRVFLDYCKTNNYELIKEVDQIINIYKKSDNTMLRLTTEKTGNKTIKAMDFKQDKLTNESFIERRETIPIVYENDDAIKSIIDFLGYKESIELRRKRYVYFKEKIKFEIDEYIYPESSQVVSIEGEKKAIKIIYEELKEKYNRYLLN